MRLFLWRAESCVGVTCRDGAVCVRGRCRCDETNTDLCNDDTNDDDDDEVCATDDGSCDASWSTAGQFCRHDTTRCHQRKQFRYVCARQLAVSAPVAISYRQFTSTRLNCFIAVASSDVNRAIALNVFKLSQTVADSIQTARRDGDATKQVCRVGSAMAMLCSNKTQSYHRTLIGSHILPIERRYRLVAPMTRSTVTATTTASFCYYACSR